MADPVRTCIGCGARRPKRELTRLVARGGRVTVDPAAVEQGRGAYVCDGRCAGRAVTKRAFGRAMKGKVEVEEGLAAQVDAARTSAGRRDGGAR